MLPTAAKRHRGPLISLALFWVSAVPAHPTNSLPAIHPNCATLVRGQKIPTFDARENGASRAYAYLEDLGVTDLIADAEIVTAAFLEPLRSRYLAVAQRINDPRQIDAAVNFVVALPDFTANFETIPVAIFDPKARISPQFGMFGGAGRTSTFPTVGRKGFGTRRDKEMIADIFALSSYSNPALAEDYRIASY